LLDFRTPVGVTLNLSSLSSPSFANSYTLSNSSTVFDGSVSYLYSSLPLTVTHKSKYLPLRHVIQGYRQLQDQGRLEEASWWEIWHRGRRIDRRNTLLYGRLYLPTSLLEALYLRRITPTTQLKISCVSSSALKSGGSVLFLLSRDFGKYSTEFLYSTDSALFGVRGLYNFGPDPRLRKADWGVSSLESDPALTHAPATASASALVPEAEPNGRFSAGAELYYGVLNKSGGMSVGARFATLPRHTGFPYTMTITLNPLMGNLSSTYAVKAGDALALCAKFDFNVYSYESSCQVGMELWKRKSEEHNTDGLEWALKKIADSERKGWQRTAGAMTRTPEIITEEDIRETTRKAALANSLDRAVEELRDKDTMGVLKARVNQDGGLRFLWEGRIKQLLYAFGLNVDLKQRDQVFSGVGLELQYSS